MSFRPWLLAASLTSAGAFSLLPSPEQAVDDLDETWMVRVRRTQWSPRDVDYVLHLSARDGAWAGSAAVDLVMTDRTTYTASDISVSDGDAFAFILTGSDDAPAAYRFTGVRNGDGAVDGTVSWIDPYGSTQTDAFTAYRRAVPRFDRQLDPEDLRAPVAAGTAGLDPALLDRLIYRAEKARSDALVVLSGGQRVCERYFGRPRGTLPVGTGISKMLAGLEPNVGLGVVQEGGGRRMAALDLALLGKAFADGGVQAADMRDGEGGWKLRHGDDDEVIGYSLSSKEGGHLLVYPEADLIVSRLIAARPDDRYNDKYEERDDFYVIRRLADRLAMQRLRSREATGEDIQ